MSDKSNQTEKAMRTHSSPSDGKFEDPNLNQEAPEVDVFRRLKDSDDLC
jgi:hypothetical protein